MDWAHVLVIVQRQTDGCSLSRKDGAVVWQSFGQLAAGCLTILEMAVDDCCCPHSLIHFGAISVYIIMWWGCHTPFAVCLTSYWLNYWTVFENWPSLYFLTPIYLGIRFISWEQLMASWNNVLAPTMCQAIIWRNSLPIYTFEDSKYWFSSLLSPTRFDFMDIYESNDLGVNTVMYSKQSTLVFCCYDWYVQQ